MHWLVGSVRAVDTVVGSDLLIAGLGRSFRPLFRFEGAPPCALELAASARGPASSRPTAP